MYKRIFLCILISALLLLLGQFFLFRTPAVFDLSLKTFLYDNGSWVVEPPKVLLMGSSRCYHGIIPATISQNNDLKEHDVVNVGAEGATPFEMFVTYKKMRAREKLGDVEICFFILDPGFFSESCFVNRMYEKILLNRSQWTVLSSRYGHFYFLPSRIFLQALRYVPYKNGEHQGFAPLPHSDFLCLEKTVSQDLPVLGDEELFPLSSFELDSLVELKKMVEEDGGIFIFVLAPMWDASSILASKIFRRQWRSLAVAIDGRIGPVRVVGSWDRDTYGLVYEDFKDRTHLSLSGAKKFTAAVFSSLEKIAHKRPVRMTELLAP